MDAPEIPDAWPPHEVGDPKLVVPMFPLPGVFLFPGMLLPLHVFEPRYRQMVEQSLDGPGRLVMGTVLTDHQSPELMRGNPPVLPIAGLGEIARHEKLNDGRYNIWLVGLARCRIREVDSEFLFRKVEAEALQDGVASAQDERALRSELREALAARGAYPEAHGEKLSLGHLADLLLMAMQLPQEFMQEYFVRIDPSERARGALTEHARRPIPRDPGGEGGGGEVGDDPTPPIP